MADVILTLTRDEVTELKRLLIKEANWLGNEDIWRRARVEEEKKLDELRQKIHDQI